LLLIVIGYVDYATGYEVSVFILYALPIAWIAWSVNLPAGLALAVLASAFWITADRASGHVYQHAWVQWERTAMHFVNFGFIAFSFSQFRRSHDRQKNRVQQLEGVLPICIACKRVRNSQGNWTDLDEYLRLQGGTTAESCICPECLSVRYH